MWPTAYLLKWRKTARESLFDNCLLGCWVFVSIWFIYWGKKVKRDATDQLCVLTGLTNLYDYKGTVCLLHKIFLLYLVFFFAPLWHCFILEIEKSNFLIYYLRENGSKSSLIFIFYGGKLRPDIFCFLLEKSIEKSIKKLWSDLPCLSWSIGQYGTI